MMTEQRSKLAMAIDFAFYRLGLRKLSPVRTALAKAYDAFPDNSYKMGPRAMPSQVPTMKPVHLCSTGQGLGILLAVPKTVSVRFGDDDPVSKGGDLPFLDRVPGTAGPAHTTIKGGGHFVQEDNPRALPSNYGICCANS